MFNAHKHPSIFVCCILDGSLTSLPRPPSNPLRHAVGPCQKYRQFFGISAMKQHRRRTVYLIHSCGFKAYHGDLVGSLPSEWCLIRKQDGALLLSKIIGGATVQVSTC